MEGVHRYTLVLARAQLVRWLSNADELPMMTSLFLHGNGLQGGYVLGFIAEHWYAKHRRYQNVLPDSAVFAMETWFSRKSIPE